MYQFRDPIHGFIDASPQEIKIIDSAPFQRLRHIKHLATTYLVYHGAEHTRFGHSLGVMHLVTKAFDSTLANYKASYGEDLFEPTTAKWYRQILRLIALTHDLGHAPYSHASEALFEGKLEHEDYTRKILYETEIADYVNEIGQAFQEENGNEYYINPELLWLIYHEKNPELNTSFIMPDFKFLRSFMDSELDCDKMDYLLRDSHYCGVNYGTYDLSRLLSSLNVYREKTNKIMQLAINRSGIHSLEEFVIARYFMYIQVYFHKTRRLLDILLVKSIESILPNKKYPLNVDEYLKFDDNVVFNKIKESQNEHTNRFINRQVMTCVYDSGTHSDTANDIKIYKLVLNELRQNLNCEVIEDTPGKLAHMIPLLEVYDVESGKGIPVLVQHLNRPASASTESVLLKSLINKPISIMRLYVEKSHASKAKELVRKFINPEGENDE
ncbi:MAG: HD domain-containing protein [Defluviitaleaceae bacterium]|nr:HD domain-containing protein [Defluviitaleaceae bacterium]